MAFYSSIAFSVINDLNINLVSTAFGLKVELKDYIPFKENSKISELRRVYCLDETSFPLTGLKSSSPDF